MSVISNAAECVEVGMTQFADQARKRPISQLISDISRVLQKVFKYFNGATISTSLLPEELVLPMNSSLTLNDFETFKLLFSTSFTILSKAFWVFWIIVTIF